MSISVLAFLIIVKLTIASDCINPWNYWWMKNVWKPLQEWYSLVTFSLAILMGACWWIGVTYLWYMHMRFNDKRKQYQKALNKKNARVAPKTKLQNYTIESFIKQKEFKEEHASKMWDLNTTEIKCGNSYEGRNAILSTFGISIEDMWKDKTFLSKLRRFKSTK